MMSIDYVREVELWFSKLMPRITPFLYGNGGPIIMVQVENTYGQFECDEKYMTWMRDLTYKHIGDNAVMITNTFVDWMHIACTKIDHLLTTLDFLPGNIFFSLFPFLLFKRSETPIDF